MHDILIIIRHKSTVLFMCQCYNCKKMNKIQRKELTTEFTAVNLECCLLATYHFKEHSEFRLYANFSNLLKTERCLILGFSTWLK